MLTSSPSPTIHALAGASGGHSFRRSSRSAAHTLSPRAAGTQSLTVSRKVQQQQHQQQRPKSPAAACHPQPFPQQTSPRESKPRTADAGTQYTPPDWPPTSTRSSVYPYLPTATTAAATDAIGATSDNAAHQAAGFDAKPPSTLPRSQPSSEGGEEPPELTEPPEPRLRVTPQASLQNVGVRRSHSALSDGSGDPSSTSIRSSSPKRTREHGGKHKTMPANYADCNPKELAAVIADMLMELIRLNDELPLSDGHLTRFHSRASPGISIHDYIQRLTLHATLSPPILLSMVFYIDRLCQYFQPFTINSLTAHRFLITAATVASKGLSDSFWTNAVYARVGGVSVKELAILELELLIRMQWRIVPSPQALVDYYRSIVARSDEYVIETDESDAGTEGGDHDDSSSRESRLRSSDASGGPPVGTGIATATDWTA